MKKRQISSMSFAFLQAGREGRDKFGKWKKEKGRVGTTNKEKLKTKNFQMVKAKYRQKQKRSFREKQVRIHSIRFNFIFSSFLDRIERFVVERQTSSVIGFFSFEFSFVVFRFGEKKKNFEIKTLSPSNVLQSTMFKSMIFSL